MALVRLFTLKKVIDDKSLTSNKVIGLGTDEARAMTGLSEGLTGYMTRDNPMRAMTGMGEGLTCYMTKDNPMRAMTGMGEGLRGYMTRDNPM